MMDNIVNNHGNGVERGTIMSGETLVEKLDEAVCCRLCHPDVTFLENVNCKSCISNN